MSRDRSQRPGDAAPARESVHDPPGEARAEHPQAPTHSSHDGEARSGGPAGTDAAPPRPDVGIAQGAWDVEAVGDAETTEDTQAMRNGQAETPDDDGDLRGAGNGDDASADPASDRDITPEQVRERLRRRAIFLRELAEARELRRRVTPHRSRRARIHAALRRRTFRLH
ncbi:hypothetical protein Acsp04_50400 [Actinomadura sp. NBRC 104425]|nr:hypothetical protein Acsp04_50400 [Actinomadura sp. NBRC 104425]